MSRLWLVLLCAAVLIATHTRTHTSPFGAHAHDSSVVVTWQVSDDVDNPTGNKILWDTGYLNGAPHKVCQIISASPVGVVPPLHIAP